MIDRDHLKLKMPCKSCPHAAEYQAKGYHSGGMSPFGRRRLEEDECDHGNPCPFASFFEKQDG